MNKKIQTSIASHSFVVGNISNGQIDRKRTDDLNNEYQFSDYHGFDTIARMQENKLSFDAAGTEGLISFIKANIASGNNDPDSIVDEAVRITGNHIEQNIRSLIMDSENIHWTVNPNGMLEMSLYENA